MYFASPDQQSFSSDDERSAREGSPSLPKLEALCDKYTDQWVNALYEGIRACPYAERNQEVEVVLQEVADVTTRLIDGMAALDRSKPAFSKLEDTVERLDRFVNRLLVAAATSNSN